MKINVLSEFIKCKYARGKNTFQKHTHLMKIHMYMQMLQVIVNIEHEVLFKAYTIMLNSIHILVYIYICTKDNIQLRDY